MLGEVLESPESLRLEASKGSAGIAGELRDGTPVTIVLGPDGLVGRVLHRANIPGRGDQTVEWSYGDYREVADGVMLPFEYSIRVGTHGYTDMRVDSVVRVDPDGFDPPGGLSVLQARDVEDGDPVRLEATQLAPGVYQVPEVRGGFAPLVVEFADHLVVADAPASFPLLGYVPMGETDPGPTMSWPAEQFVAALRERWPDKPVEYVVLTHHHEDHIAGIRAFVAEGATVLGTPHAIEAARRIARLEAPDVADALARNGAELQSKIVEDRRRLTDGEQVLDILRVRGHPHSEEMLVLSLPGVSGMFVSDILTPGPVESYPSSNHAALDEAFARWLRTTDVGMPDRIWTMHGDGPLTPAHLARLESMSGTADDR